MNIVKNIKCSIRLNDKKVEEDARLLYCGFLSQVEEKKSKIVLSEKEEKQLKKIWTLFEGIKVDTLCNISILEKEIAYRKEELKQLQRENKKTEYLYKQYCYLKQAMQAASKITKCPPYKRKEDTTIKTNGQNPFAVISKKMYVSSYVFLVYPTIAISNEDDRVQETYQLLLYYTQNIADLKNLYHLVLDVKNNLGNLFGCLLDWEHIHSKEALSAKYQELTTILGLKHMLMKSKIAPFAIHQNGKITLENIIRHFLTFLEPYQQEFSLYFPKKEFLDICLEVMEQNCVTKEVIQQAEKGVQVYLEQIRKTILFLEQRRKFCAQQWNMSLQKTIQKQLPDKKTKDLYAIYCELNVFRTLQRIAQHPERFFKQKQIGVQELCLAILHELQQEKSVKKEWERVNVYLAEKYQDIFRRTPSYAFEERDKKALQNMNALKNYVHQNIKEGKASATVLEKYIPEYCKAVMSKTIELLYAEVMPLEQYLT